VSDWTDGTVSVLLGDVRARLRDLPAESVHCVVGSPPYWGLRSYLPDGHESKYLELGIALAQEAKDALGGYHREFLLTAPATTGWRPACTHDHDPVPAVVLDPFAGSGTTLAVAKRLGRRAVGIELNPDDLALIEQRVHWAIHQRPEGPREAEVEGQASLFEVAP
jgi:DNA modification methylase